MEPSHRDSAAQIRSRIARGSHDPAELRAALLRVPPAARDGWLDLVLGLDELPDDGPALPRDCVPYVPCPVDALLRMVELADIAASDVFVDIGAGLGRAAAFVQLWTGASAIGVDILEPALVVAARTLAARLPGSRISIVEGDAAARADDLALGSVFFLYCPFSGERLRKVLAALEAIARTRMIRVCCVDLPLPPCPWLALAPQLSEDLAIYRSTLHDEAAP